MRIGPQTGDPDGNLGMVITIGNGMATLATATGQTGGGVSSSGAAMTLGKRRFKRLL